MDFERIKRNLYSPEAIDAATGGRVVPNLLHQWSKRHYLTGALKPKRPRPMRFGLGQVWGLALMAEFRAAGVDMDRAAAWARYFALQWYERNLREFICFSPGQESPDYVPDAEIVEYLRSMESPKTLIAINTKKIALSICEALQKQLDIGEVVQPVTKSDMEALYA